MLFHTIVRNWCKTYRPMLDNEAAGNRRFYLTDTTSGVVEMAKGIPNKFSPFVMMESSIDGYIDCGKIYRTYPVYFFVRARGMSNGDAAMEAKEEAWIHAQNFLTWLRKLHDDDPTPTREYARIDMEETMDIVSVGPLENGWHAVMVQPTRLELLNLCENEDLYIKPCEC